MAKLFWGQTPMARGQKKNEPRVRERLMTAIACIVVRGPVPFFRCTSKLWRKVCACIKVKVWDKPIPAVVLDLFLRVRVHPEHATALDICVIAANFRTAGTTQATNVKVVGGYSSRDSRTAPAREFKCCRASLVPIVRVRFPCGAGSPFRNRLGDFISTSRSRRAPPISPCSI